MKMYKTGRYYVVLCKKGFIKIRTTYKRIALRFMQQKP